ncbi:CvpA family protein [Methylomonas sp. MED-D]|nr:MULTISPECIES: CvpA family protein [Methylomonas]MDT4329419.1 CvpA family protein [Methylomonas sp. MV1]WGS87400.1 CvpA family protein [Methylomonas sp. UP202]
MLDFVPWQQMLWVDYLIIVIVGGSALMGLFRGFVKEAFALTIWSVAVWVGVHYSRDVAVLLQSTISYPSARAAAAFALLFFATLILGSLISFLLSQLIESTGLTGSDRLLGMLFGIVRGSVLVALLVMMAGVTPLPEDPWWKQSVLIPPFQALALWLKNHMPAGLADYIHYR